MFGAGLGSVAHIGSVVAAGVAFAASTCAAAGVFGESSVHAKHVRIDESLSDPPGPLRRQITLQIAGAEI
jgi:hypothetical protein